ncbi:hypothetical protein, partial [Pseudomonas syringae group genomosp. 7]|uniref:hypothetical protein n=1 Tax=Pseudomonas syringae group genomosp. 7 TaxID=251699 RepID=UPI00376FD8EC
MSGIQPFCSSTLFPVADIYATPYNAPPIANLYKDPSVTIAQYKKSRHDYLIVYMFVAGLV